MTKSTILICITFSEFIISSCVNSKKTSTHTVSVHCVYVVPIVKRDYSVDTVINEYDIHFYGKYRIFQAPIEMFETDSVLFVRPKRESIYFVYHTDSVNGKLYYDDPNFGLNNKSIKVDSMLTSISFENTKYDTLLNFKTDSTALLENGDFLKVYTYPETSGISEKFRIWLYYTRKLTDVDYSFSAKLDNKPRQKLYKIRILAEGGTYQGFKMPAREYSLLMTRNNIKDASKLKDFLKQYRE